MSQLWRLLKIGSSGGALHGIQTVNESASGVVIHVHGTWGNFYGNDFVPELATYYDSRGWTFLTCNFPGHDETAVHEKFEDFPAALEAWAKEVLCDRPLILQGHSLGALKLLYYLRCAEAQHPPAALILLAPFDVVTFYGGQTVSEVQRRRAEAARALQLGGDVALVPKAVFDFWDIGADAFLRATQEDGPWDQFPSRRADLSVAFRGLEVPTLVVIGESDFAAYPSPRDIVERVNAQTRATAVLIEGAPHNFAGKTSELTHALDRFFSDLDPR